MAGELLAFGIAAIVGKYTPRTYVYIAIIATIVFPVLLNVTNAILLRLLARFTRISDIILIALNTLILLVLIPTASGFLFGVNAYCNSNYRIAPSVGISLVDIPTLVSKRTFNVFPILQIGATLRLKETTFTQKLEIQGFGQYATFRNVYYAIAPIINATADTTTSDSSMPLATSTSTALQQAPPQLFALIKTSSFESMTGDLYGSFIDYAYAVPYGDLEESFQRMW